MNRIPIVMSTQRTGSSFLFLHFHETVHHVCFEPYNSEPQRKEYREVQKEDGYSSRVVDVFGYMKMLSKHGPIDLKMEIAPAFAVEEIFKHRKEYDPVILRRKNKLKQYISLLAAGRTNVWLSDKPIKEKGLDVSVEAFKKYYTKMATLEQVAVAALDGPNTIISSYEDLAEKLPEISEYWGVPISHEPKTVKIHKDYSFVNNRNELNAIFPAWAL